MERENNITSCHICPGPSTFGQKEPPFQNPWLRACCHSSEAKYRCPGCDVRTCSVGCVKAHKVERECDGKRCKTAFVSQTEFSDNHLLSDYRFLEEVGSYIDSTHRDKVLRSRGVAPSN
ncbi:box C/D snoRNA protein 1-like [Dysidea avara]|uniref:box C/D snoRNA protein 1-like n=1 Tax=Dysidea avara TaxID=196820 RepID=UPI0033215894